MKRYSDKENNLYIVGSTDEIKATYKAICRHNTWDCWQTHIEPEFLDFPEFSEGKKIYGLCIDENFKMTVVNSDTLLDLIIKDEIKEEIEEEVSLLTQYERFESVGMEEIEEPYNNEYFEPSDYDEI